MNVTLPNGRVISGVPEGTTKEQIMQKAIAAGLAQESDFATPSAPEGDAVRNVGFQPVEVPEKKSFMDKLKDFAQGGEEGSRNVFSAPELNELSWRAFKTGAGGLLTGNPEEIQQMIAANYPEAEFGMVEDQMAVRFPSGDYLLNPKGIDPLDVARFGTDVAAFTPAGGITGFGVGQLAKGAAVAGATQGAMQGVEAAVGGEFNPEDVALEAATQGAMQVAAPVVRAGASRVKESVSPFISKVMERAGVASSASPYEATAKALEAANNQSIIPKVMADPEIMKAADDLGINVNPGVYSSSEVFRQFERALKMLPDSKLPANEINTLNELGQRADDLVKEWTGTNDKSLVSAEFTEKMLNTVKEMEVEANALYDTFRDVIPEDTILQTRKLNTLDYINDRANAVGGFENLPSDLKKINQQLSAEGGVTQGLIDELRMDVGETIGRKSERFKSLGSARLKQLYSALSEDSLKQPELLGFSEEVMQARNLVKQRKELEETLQGALGRDLSKSLSAELGIGVKQMQGGKSEKFNKVMDSIPEADRQTIAISALNDIFSGGTAKSKQFGLDGFISSYEALQRNEKAASNLWQYIPPEAKKRVDDIYKVSKGLSDSNRRPLANPSGSAAASAAITAMNAPDGLLSKLFKTSLKMGAGAGASAPFDAGVMGAGFGLMAALKSAKGKASDAADEMLSSPAFKEAVQKYIDGDAATANTIFGRMKSAGAWIAEQPPEVKRAIARQGLIQYLMSEDEE